MAPTKKMAMKKAAPMKVKKTSTKQGQTSAMQGKTSAIKKGKNFTLGVVRLDYHYPPAVGDIDSPGSYNYRVLYKMVKGMTFEMAQSGRLTPSVKKEFKDAVRELVKKGACCITGDCGFMMAFQKMARDVTKKPVFMSSMVQCPLVSAALNEKDKVLILTANSKTLEPQKDALLNHCGIRVEDKRFIIRGCQDVPGFDAVAKGEKVDVARVTPGMVQMTKKILKQHPSIGAIVLECTELPPYADALRDATGLPVWDAITCADFFIKCRKDNTRF